MRAGGGPHRAAHPVLREARASGSTRGQRYGFIRFGSRVDVYLPPDARPQVAIGDKVKATSTVLAESARRAWA